MVIDFEANNPPGLNRGVATSGIKIRLAGKTALEKILPEAGIEPGEDDGKLNSTSPVPS